MARNVSIIMPTIRSSGIKELNVANNSLNPTSLNAVLETAIKMPQLTSLNISASKVNSGELAALRIS